MTALVEAIPLAKGSDGVYRLSGTRVTLDVVIGAFHKGATAEEIAQKFPSVPLGDIYQVIGYYLKHQRELDEYLAARRREASQLLSEHPEWSPGGLRERLQARGAAR